MACQIMYPPSDRGRHIVFGSVVVVVSVIPCEHDNF